MRVLEVCINYTIAWGGPPRVVSDVAEQMAARGLDVVVLSTYDHENEPLNEKPTGAQLILYKTGFLKKVWWGTSWELASYLRANIRSFNLVHLHEMWGFPILIAGLLCRKYNIPYIVTPHGSISPWALSQKRTLKQLFSRLFHKRILGNAAFVQLLTQEELGFYNQYLPGQKNGILLPNGVAIDTPVSQQNEISPSTASKEKPYWLFLSRIHKKKGLDLLVQAYIALHNEGKVLPQLIIAGPAEQPPLQNQLKEWVDQAGLAQSILFIGAVKSEEKQTILQHAEAVVLTSYSEGFPITLLEAMMYQKPLIVSDQVGIQHELEASNAAIICKPEIASVKDALSTFFQLSQSEKEAMGKNGYTLLQQEYELDAIGNRIYAMYEKAMNN